MPPCKRAGSEVFRIGNFGYVFGGLDDSGIPHNDLWMYDPISDLWTQLALLPSPTRYSAVSCVIGSIVYIGTGFDGIAYYQDWWEYKAGNNSWAQKTNFPGPNSSTACMHHQE